MKFLAGLEKRLSLAAENLAGILIALLLAVLLLQVTLRFMFNSALDWSEELSRIFFVFAVFVGVCGASHVRFEALLERLNVKNSRLVKFFNLLIASLFVVVLITIYFKYEVNAFTISTPLLEIPFIYLITIIPIAFSLQLIVEWIRWLQD
jgi:TRAP-type C4-dicarboxylate transport system permease small subunit